MKKLIFILILLIPNIALANTFIEKTVSWYKIKVIQYDLSSDIYNLKVVKTDNAESLWDLLKQNNAISWVNWVFFCPTDYDWCNTTKSRTDNERYIEWEKFASYNSTWDRAVFAWTKDKKPFIFQTDKINNDKESDIYYWVWNYPLLLNEWKNMLEYYYDVWLIFNKLTYKATRNFICSDKESKNIFFWLVYDATIDDLVQVLSDFWCYNALNLDAWLSTTFIYNWKYVVWPQKRNILDAIAIERIWFNVKEILKISDKIFTILINKSENKSKKNKNTQIKILNNYIKQLDNIKTKIYNKYSTDIIEKDELWQDKNIWYKIEINDLKTLKIIYLINQINYNLKITRDLIQSKIDEENSQN